MINVKSKIVLCSFGIIALAALVTILCVHQQSLIVVAVLILAIIYLCYMLLRQYDNTNNKFRYLVEAIENKDNSLRFVEKSGVDSDVKFHKGLNQLNDIVNDIKIKSEAKEHYFYAIINQASTGLIVRDSSGSIVLANRSILNICQLETLYSVEQLNSVSLRLKDIISSIEPGDELLESIKLNEKREHLSIQASGLTQAGNKFVIVSVKNLKTEMERNELDSWIKLIRVLTHEIMNSLAPISSVSETLNDLYSKGEIDESNIDMIKKGIALIYEQSEGLIGFVDNYRSLTMIPEPEYCEISVNDLIERWGRLAREIAPSNIELDVKLIKDSSTVTTDLLMLDRVVSNVIKNGVEAVDNLVSPKITISYIYPSSFEISNNGPKISDEVLDNIWVPFFTTKSKGSGIGLSLCRQIIKRMNGSLEVRSTDNITTFILKL